MALTEKFIAQYLLLESPRTRWRDRFYDDQKKNPWDIRKETFLQMVDQGSSAIDFIWEAVSFSLFSKVIYNYSPGNYRYLDDYFDFHYSQKMMQRIYRGKVLNLVDDKCRLLPDALREQFYQHSVSHMPRYIQTFLGFFEFFGPRCCINLDHESLLEEVVRIHRFAEEFSANPEDLSFLYFDTLKKQFAHEAVL